MMWLKVIAIVSPALAMLLYQTAPPGSFRQRLWGAFLAAFLSFMLYAIFLQLDILARQQNEIENLRYSKCVFEFNPSDLIKPL